MSDTEKENTNETEDNVTDVTDVTSPENKASEVTAKVTFSTDDVTVSIAEQIESADVLEETTKVVPVKERPCFRVYDDLTTLSDGTKLRPGVYWHTCDDFSKDQPEIIDVWVCGPLYIMAQTHDLEENNFGRLLKFQISINKWKTWAMPMELLRASGEELRGEVLSMGLELSNTRNGRQLFLRYLQERTPYSVVRCALQTGWHKNSFVLTDQVIGPEAKEVFFQSGERLGDEYGQAGSLESWKKEIAIYAIDNPMLMLGLSAGFSGPILGKCLAEGGGIHLVGDSSCGKTTITDASVSIWGGTSHRRSWKATANGIEGIASLYNDNLLALDEISQCDPREVGEIVYTIGNGMGKQRAGRSGGAKTIRRWRCFVVSNGEKTIRTTMAEGGLRTKAGQEIRLLDIFSLRRYGCWDTLHGFESGAAMSDAIKRASAMHYGRAGRAFLEQLTHDKRDFSAALEQIKALPAFACSGAEGQEKRAAGRFALIALAGELATEYGITGWPEGAAIEAAAIAFQTWKSQRGRGNDERRQILEQLSSFIERHGDSRFSDRHSDIDKVRDRAGWWEQDGDDSRTYLFNKDGMNEATSGHDLKRALDVLEEFGVIPPANSAGERAKTIKVQKRGVRLYEVGYEKLQQAIRSNAGYVSMDTAVTTETQPH